jgi:hypothetical protein
MLPLVILFGRYLAGKPRKRDIGLDAAQFVERSRGSVALPSHTGGRRQDSMCTDEIGELADALARQPHGLIVVTPTNCA